MPLTVRLPRELESLVEQISTRHGMSKSDWVREAIRARVEADVAASPYAAYVKAIGRGPRSGSGRGNLAAGAKRLLRERLRAKHRR